MNKKRFVIYIGVFLVLIAVALIGGFQVVGSPRENRMRRLDEKRISDLSAISSNVDSHYREHKKLPETLADMKKEYIETKEPYEYKKLDDKMFMLCATFLLPSEKDDSNSKYNVTVPPYYEDPYSEYPYSTQWKHESGRTCFRREIRLQEEISGVKQPRPYYYSAPVLN